MKWYHLEALFLLLSHLVSYVGEHHGRQMQGDEKVAMAWPWYVAFWCIVLYATLW